MSKAHNREPGTPCPASAADASRTCFGFEFASRNDSGCQELLLVTTDSVQDITIRPWRTVYCVVLGIHWRLGSVDLVPYEHSDIPSR